MALRPDHDTYLKEAVGQEVALSVIGGPADADRRHTVIAIRTPKMGVLKPNAFHIAFGGVAALLRFWLAAVVGAFLFFLVVWIVIGGLFRIVTTDGWLIGGVLGAIVGVAWFLYALVKPILSIVEISRAAKALEGRPQGVPVLGEP